MPASLFIEELNIHPDWNAFLSEENKALIAVIEDKVLRSSFTPSANNVLRFFNVPLLIAKVVILGQDPYPQPGVATGRAFEVGMLQSWSQPFQNISLKNILRALYKAYTGEVLLYNQLKEKLYTEFPILPPGKLFEHWESQGVLLLNTSFTCEPGNPGSHRKLWEEFTRRLLHYIAENAPHITWFVWGNHAARAIKSIQVHKMISTMHPMMCFDLPGRNNDFLYGKYNCFEPFIQNIDWTGYAFTKVIHSPKLLF
jgi:uracil-DNA glycosylase